MRKGIKRDRTVRKGIDYEKLIKIWRVLEANESLYVAQIARMTQISEPTVRYYQLEGEGQEPTNSVLVGAAPGSPVTAPITGVVTRVKQYLLYGKYEDVQIDIRPEKMGGVTISLLFISDPSVSIGETVTAGKTQLGKVRQCPEELGACVAEYTHDSGSHVHLQVTGEPGD